MASEQDRERLVEAFRAHPVVSPYVNDSDDWEPAREDEVERMADVALRVLAPAAETTGGTVGADERGRELAKAHEDLDHLVRRVEANDKTLDLAFITRLARARLNVELTLAAAGPDDDERRWDLGNALGWELETESPSWREITKGIADLRDALTPPPATIRTVDDLDGLPAGTVLRDLATELDRLATRARGAMPQEMDGDEYGRLAENISDQMVALADRLGLVETEGGDRG